MSQRGEEEDGRDDPLRVHEVIMMLKSAHVFSLVLLLFVLEACQQAAPSVGSVQATVVLTTPPPAISSPLIGTYTTIITSQDLAGHPELDTSDMRENAGGMDLPGTWTLTYRSDAVWLAQDNRGWGRQYIGTGFYRITQNQVTLLTDSKCLEYYVPYYGPEAQSATYRWQLSGTTLVLQTANDFCLPRKIVLTSHHWTRLN
jgi:hypothetical protein